MEQLPETTLKLLQAVSLCGHIERVHILPKRIVYFPSNTRQTGQRIEDAGIADLVQRFVTHSLSKSVAHHFREGAYCLKRGTIKILK